MPREELHTGATLWVRENLSAVRLGKMTRNYHLMRYEDLVANPTESLKLILSMFGVDASELSFLSGQTATLDRPGHAIAGNPMKFDSGKLTIRADDAWKTDMPPADRNTVERIAGRVMKQLGY